MGREQLLWGCIYDDHVKLRNRLFVRVRFLKGKEEFERWLRHNGAEIWIQGYMCGSEMIIKDWELK